MIYRIVVKRKNPRSSHHKENFFSFSSFFILYLYDMVDVSWTYCDNHFTIEAYLTLSCITDVNLFYKLKVRHHTNKRFWPDLFQDSLYCSDLELNLQYLQGMPVYRNQTVMLYALNLYREVCQLFLNKTGKNILCVIPTTPEYCCVLPVILDNYITSWSLNFLTSEVRILPIAFFKQC